MSHPRYIGWRDRCRCSISARSGSISDKSVRRIRSPRAVSLRLIPAFRNEAPTARRTPLPRQFAAATLGGGLACLADRQAPPMSCASSDKSSKTGQQSEGAGGEWNRAHVRPFTGLRREPIAIVRIPIDEPAPIGHSRRGGPVIAATVNPLYIPGDDLRLAAKTETKVRVKEHRIESLQERSRKNGGVKTNKRGP